MLVGIEAREPFLFMRLGANNAKEINGHITKRFVLSMCHYIWSFVFLNMYLLELQYYCEFVCMYIYKCVCCVCHTRICTYFFCHKCLLNCIYLYVVYNLKKLHSTFCIIFFFDIVFAVCHFMGYESCSNIFHYHIYRSHSFSFSVM